MFICKFILCITFFLFLYSSRSNVGSGTPQSDRSEGRSSTPGISLQQPSTSPAPSTSALSASRSRSPRDRNISRPAVAAQAPRETRRGQRPIDTGIGDRLMSLLEQPVPKPHVPEDERDEAYYFALSIVPMLHRLNKDSRNRPKWRSSLFFTASKVANLHLYLPPALGQTSHPPQSQPPPPPTQLPSPIQPIHPPTQTGSFTQMSPDWEDPNDPYYTLGV